VEEQTVAGREKTSAFDERPVVFQGATGSEHLHEKRRVGEKLDLGL